MKAFWAIVKKELRSVSRERTIMIAVGIQLFIASFSSVVLIGVLSFYDPDAIGAAVRVSIRVGVLGEAGPQVIDRLRTRNVRPVIYDGADAAERAFQAGRLDAIVYAPTESGGVTDMKLVLPQAEARAALILILLKEPLKQIENDLRGQHGVELRYTQLGGLPSTTFEFLYSVIIPALLFFPAFVAGSMAVDSIAEEIENQTLDTLRVGPVSAEAIFGAKMAAALLLAGLQCAAWLVLLRFNQIVVQNAGLVWLLAVLVAAINAIGSGLVAAAFRDRERAQFVYSIVIVAAVAISTAFNFSPINLMTRLASGGQPVTPLELGVYVAALGALAVFFMRASRRLTAG